MRFHRQEGNEARSGGSGLLGTHAEERSEGISRSSGGHECPCDRGRVHPYQRCGGGDDLRRSKGPDPTRLEMVVHGDPLRDSSMSGHLSIALVAGPRPNFMKIAPLYHALAARKEADRAKGIDLRVSVVHTGQHYDENMSDVFFRDLGIPNPDRHLEVGSGSHAEQTAKIMVAFEKVVLEDRPDFVVVVGDVNSTIACALTAKKLGVRVAHVEAGLRSFDMGMPEEINRKLTDAISDLLFVTEESGVRNLLAEGVAKEKIFLVGNVMIDTLKCSIAKIDGGGFQPSMSVKKFCDGGRRYAVLTLHRPSNVDSRKALEPIWGAISEVAREIPILFPVHPRTREKISAFGLDGAGVALVEPIGYLDM